MIAKLTGERFKLVYELEGLKNKFSNANFDFSQFSILSPKAEHMINELFKTHASAQKKEGLGYAAVKPPFNHNYTSPIDSQPEIVRQYGKPEDYVEIKDEVKSKNKRNRKNKHPKKLLSRKLNLFMVLVHLKVLTFCLIMQVRI